MLNILLKNANPENLYDEIPLNICEETAYILAFYNLLHETLQQKQYDEFSKLGFNGFDENDDSLSDHIRFFNFSLNKLGRYQALQNIKFTPQPFEKYKESGAIWDGRGKPITDDQIKELQTIAQKYW